MQTSNKSTGNDNKKKHTDRKKSIKESTENSVKTKKNPCSLLLALNENTQPKKREKQNKSTKKKFNSY